MALKEAKSGRPVAVAGQHAGDLPGPADSELGRLVQEAVDLALATIMQDEQRLSELSERVAQRLREREEGGASIAALEGRLAALEGRSRAIHDRHARTEEAVSELMLHTGHREPLDVRRIPPVILERSYQTALDELADEIGKSRGRDEVERILDETLADVRGRAKGAEVFERQEGRILIQGLAKAIERKLLSARAAQVGFDEILKHLRLYVPAFRPRSLPAMIRAKSAEYAVESAVAHHERLERAEERLARLLDEAKRIEREAREADARAGESTSKSFMQAAMERKATHEEFHGRVKALEKRAAEAEARLERALERLESIERYASRVEAAMIRRTKEGTYKGDFTPVIDAVQEALADGKPRTVQDLARRVKGVDRAVVEAVVREGLKEGIYERVGPGQEGKVRLRR